PAASAAAQGEDASASGALQTNGPADHIVLDGLVGTYSTGSGVYLIGFGWGTAHDITVQNSQISNSEHHGVYAYRALTHTTVDHNTILSSGDNPNVPGNDPSVGGTAFGI